MSPTGDCGADAKHTGPSPSFLCSSAPRPPRCAVPPPISPRLCAALLPPPSPSPYPPSCRGPLVCGVWGGGGGGRCHSAIAWSATRASMTRSPSCSNPTPGTKQSKDSNRLSSPFGWHALLGRQCVRIRGGACGSQRVRNDTWFRCGGGGGGHGAIPAPLPPPPPSHPSALHWGADGTIRPCTVWGIAPQGCTAFPAPPLTA